jgi:hypothetical protein
VWVVVEFGEAVGQPSLKVQELLVDCGQDAAGHEKVTEVGDGAPVRFGSAVRLFWGQLLRTGQVFEEFRSHFVGKASPVHFFWGAMDLACTRFSGRPAPPHPPGGAPNLPDWVNREAYDAELSSCGFWPGGGEEGAFYAYAYPEPAGFADYPVRPAAASYQRESGEFVLPYEVVAAAAHPEQALSEFLQSTYEAAAELGRWDRPALEVRAWQHH